MPNFRPNASGDGPPWSDSLRAPSGGLVFVAMRLLFVASLFLIGLVGPVLLILGGLSAGRPELVVLGALGGALAFGLGAMVAAGQRKLRSLFAGLARETGLRLAETPDLVLGLAQLSLVGELRGRAVSVAFENLAAAGTTEYLPGGGKWFIRRTRRHLVATVRLPEGVAEGPSTLVDLRSRAVPLSGEIVAWLRGRGYGEMFLGEGRAGFRWDVRMTKEGVAEVARGIHLLVELAERLEAQKGAGKPGPSVCPICEASISFNPRYPLAVCHDCVRRACDEEGRALDFYNVDFGGGFMAVFREGGARREGHDCRIDGRACRADEARFGGIVVQLREEGRRELDERR